MILCSFGKTLGTSLGASILFGGERNVFEGLMNCAELDDVLGRVLRVISELDLSEKIQKVHKIWTEFKEVRIFFFNYLLGIF